MDIKWYNNLIKSDIDGLIPLLDLFDSEEGFILHFFKSVKFFNLEQVKKQAQFLLEQIEAGNKIPVRYSERSKTLFHHTKEDNIKGIGSKAFKNKKEAQGFSLLNEMFHKETNIRICIDKDGNYHVKEQIFRATGYRVSQGNKSNLQNYVISHVWGKTDNPLFFSSLWNIILVPNHLAFILDKPDTNSEIVRKIKKAAKAICFYLYNPNELMKMVLIEENSFESDEIKWGGELTQLLLKGKMISFIDSCVIYDIATMS